MISVRMTVWGNILLDEKKEEKEEKKSISLMTVRASYCIRICSHVVLQRGDNERDFFVSLHVLSCGYNRNMNDCSSRDAEQDSEDAHVWLAFA